MDAPEKKYRIDVIEEETGTVIQSVRGIPERRMLALIGAFVRVGGLLREFMMVKEALHRSMGRRE